MPEGWGGSVVGEHFRRNLAWYVLGSSLLTLAGVGWTIAELAEIKRLVAVR